MVQILKQKRAPLPDAIFVIDGSHQKCCGSKYSERLSYKYKWSPCFNVSFIIERVLGTIVAFNLDEAASKHDVTVLRESWFYNNIEQIMNGWIIIADKGYKNTTEIAAQVKKNDKRRQNFSKNFWKTFNSARVDVERVFAHFFYNKFKLLGNWPGKHKKTFEEWSLNVICCIILYNILKIKNQAVI